MQENDWNQNYGGPIPPYGYPKPPRRGFAIASLVLGILSLVLCCMYGGFLGIPGLILGIVSLVKKEDGMGMAIAGMITSFFGLIYGILMVMATVMTFRYGIMNMDEETLWNLAENIYGMEQAQENGVDGTELPDTEQKTDRMDLHADAFAGKAFVLEDASVIYFEPDGAFTWYDDDAAHADAYYAGTYELYQAEFADAYLMTYIGEYGVTEEELADLYREKDGGALYDEENFTCLVLHNVSRICDGEETLVEPYDTNYMGFYADGYYDAVNMESGKDAVFSAR